MRLNPDTQDQAALVQGLAPLVQRLAHKLKASLPASVETDDLVQYGWLGALAAIKRHQPQPGYSFESYATLCIRGAMIDGLRQEDWLPRQARQSMQRIEAAISTLHATLGRAPSETEIARHLELDVADYRALLFKAHGHPLVFLEDLSAGGAAEFLDRYAAGPADEPQAALLASEFRTRLIAAIAALPVREQTLMGLLYTEGLNLREIGAVLEVSESRVCQLHGQAIARLRAQLRDDLPPTGECPAAPRRRPVRPAAPPPLTATCSAPADTALTEKNPTCG